MDVTLLEALYILVLGMIIVFIVLYLLMGTIALIRHFSSSKQNKNDAEKIQAAPAVQKSLPAPGSCGSIQLFNVPDRTAAMLMAIVADKLQTPLNELRFISIKEINED